MRNTLKHSGDVLWDNQRYLRKVFRYSGVIEIFKRTGFITKLQKAMGPSSINVSLTYLRGLEIAELKEEDMPMVWF